MFLCVFATLTLRGFCVALCARVFYFVCLWACSFCISFLDHAVWLCYEVDYDQTQPWLILEARRMRGLSDKTEITPMLRLIHSRYFVELGVNNSSQIRANFMYIF